MKAKFYTLVILVLYHSVFNNPVTAQCNCANGEPASELSYTVVMPPTASATTISFPRFDMAMGTLSCVILRDTVTMFSTLGIRNLDPYSLEYNFLLILGNAITGPGISISNSGQRPYGPDLLGGNGTPTDSISYGPDTLINGVINARTNLSNMVPYYGSSGTVDFNYSTNGGAVSTGGGTNFSQVIRTQSYGVFTLSYYWCPPDILSRGFRNFDLTTDYDKIKLQWNIDNEQPHTSYEVEFSTDGIHFSGTGDILSTSPGGNYQHTISASNTKIQFIRIKQTDAKGRVTYSVVRSVVPARSVSQVSVYPNPVTNRINIRFPQNLSGEHAIELYNANGQLMLQQRKMLSNQSEISLDLKSRPASGLYYLRISSRENPGKISSTTIKL